MWTIWIEYDPETPPELLGRFRDENDLWDEIDLISKDPNWFGTKCMVKKYDDLVWYANLRRGRIVWRTRSSGLSSSL